MPGGNNGGHSAAPMRPDVVSTVREFSGGERLALVNGQDFYRCMSVGKNALGPAITKRTEIMPLRVRTWEPQGAE